MDAIVKTILPCEISEATGENCRGIFHRNADRREHYRRAHRASEVVCPWCSATSTKMADLKRHVAGRHADTMGQMRQAQWEQDLGFYLATRPAVYALWCVPRPTTDRASQFWMGLVRRKVEEGKLTHAPLEDLENWWAHGLKAHKGANKITPLGRMSPQVTFSPPRRVQPQQDILALAMSTSGLSSSEDLGSATAATTTFTERAECVSSQTCMPPPPPSSMDLLTAPMQGISAMTIIEHGCLPMLPPARRDFECGNHVELPFGEGTFKWPPSGWQQYSASRRLSAFLVMAGNLELQVQSPLGAPDVDPNLLVAKYNMLVLPGTRVPAPQEVGMPGLVRAQSGLYQHFRELAIGGNPEHSPVMAVLRPYFQLNRPSTGWIVEKLNKASIPILLGSASE